jgi:hypothetical protein
MKRYDNFNQRVKGKNFSHIERNSMALENHPPLID